MGIPLQKAFLTLARLYMRPINKMLVASVKARGQDTYLYRFFTRFGNAAYRYDTRMTRILEGLPRDQPIPELSERRAFETGIDWFGEIVFFYGLILFICFFEINKAEKARINQEKALAKLKKAEQC